MNDNAWDKFVDWWTECDEDEISKNEFLWFAYQTMWLHNEVLNGGYDQFFDNKEDYWNMRKTSKLFKKYLPKDMFAQFSLALKAHKRGKSCEEYTRSYNEEAMQTFLEELAKKVVSLI